MFSAIAKKDGNAQVRASLFFQGSASIGGPALQRNRLGGSVFKQVRPHIQRSSTSNAPIAIDTHSTEKSICPIGGMSLRTGFKTGSQSCESTRTPGA
jgi:hypothetical protein